MRTLIIRSIQNAVKMTAVDRNDLVYLYNSLSRINLYAFSSMDIVTIVEKIITDNVNNKEEANYDIVNFLLELRFCLDANGVNIDDLKEILRRQTLSIKEAISLNDQLRAPIANYGDNLPIDVFVVIMYVLRVHINYLKIYIQNLEKDAR